GAVQALALTAFAIVRRSANQIHSAAAIRRPKPIGPCGLAWLEKICQPKPSNRSSAGHGARLDRKSAAAAAIAAIKSAQDPVRLMKDPTPPTHGSTHVVSSTSATARTSSGDNLPAAARFCVLRINRASPVPPVESSAV